MFEVEILACALVCMVASLLKSVSLAKVVCFKIPQTFDLLVTLKKMSLPPFLLVELMTLHIECMVAGSGRRCLKNGLAPSDLS